ncbi:MAG TPA: hypothetical protein VGE94_13300 [Chloroflexota bacterium]
MLAPTGSDRDINVSEVLVIERQRPEPVEYLTQGRTSLLDSPERLAIGFIIAFAPSRRHQCLGQSRRELATLVGRCVVQPVEQRQSRYPIAGGDSELGLGDERAPDTRSLMVGGHHPRAG